MNKTFKGFYKNKKVLVTGHTGFKGSWLSLWLNLLEAKVIGYSVDIPSQPSLFKSLNLENKITHIYGDIRNLDNFKDVINTYKPEIIFHCAAQPLVLPSYKEPVLTYETNIMGTVNILEAARLSDSVKIILNITSDKCYENKEWFYGYRETENMGGYDPYSSSKGCAELITSAYRRSFFNKEKYGITHNVSVASARAGNVIGGGDWADYRLIPDFIRAISVNEELEIRSPGAIRPWQHVLEALSGYLWLVCLLGDNPIKYSEGWNFGPFEEDIITVKKIIDECINIWGSGSYKITKQEKSHEAKLLKLDIGKAVYRLNWKPVLNWKQAIEYTITWYKTFYLNKEKDIYKFSIEQIEEYTNEARRNNINWSII